MVLIVVGYENQNTLIALKILVAKLVAAGQLAVFAPPVVKHHQGFPDLHREPGMMIIGHRRFAAHNCLLLYASFYYKPHGRK